MPFSETVFDRLTVADAREVSLFRITRVVEGPGRTTLRVEGRIVAEWVSVLERECWLALEDNGPVRLDLSAVVFADGLGVAALRRFRGNGLEIINCPQFIEELLRP